MGNSGGILESQNADSNTDSKYYANEISERNEDSTLNWIRSGKELFYILSMSWDFQ